MSRQENEVSLVLYNLRSAHNVGAIFRIAACLPEGRAVVGQIYLIGRTPAPKDRFGRANPKIAKTALGAERVLPWRSFPNFSTFLKFLKTARSDNPTLIALEQSPRALNYRRVKIAGPTAIIFGPEDVGLPPAVLKHCNLVAEIPMGERKESLNVAVAAGVFLFQLWHWGQ